MDNYVRYILHLDEPVKMGRQGDQSSTESLSYIAGSTLRGAIIAGFIDHYYADTEEDLSRNKDSRSKLFSDTYFSDAFPCAAGIGLMPVPSIYYANKHKLREAKAAYEENCNKELAVHCCLYDIPAEGEVRVGTDQYCSFDEDVIRTFSVAKEANLHIRIQDENSESAMFRYEAIAEGQLFIGLIRCADEETADQYYRVMKDRVMYLGGSRGSGYGRCRLHLQQSWSKI